MAHTVECPHDPAGVPALRRSSGQVGVVPLSVAAGRVGDRDRPRRSVRGPRGATRVVRPGALHQRLRIDARLYPRPIRRPARWLARADYLPRSQLVGVPHGLRRARRRQPAIAERQVDAGGHQPGEVLLCRGAVEVDAVDCRMIGEQSAKVVGHHAVRLDGGVQASRPPTRSQHVPHRDAVATQGSGADVVRLVGVEPEDLTGDAPEPVARVGVVLLRPQGRHAGHVAEDQDAGVIVDDRRQSVQQRCSHRLNGALTTPAWRV
jgi:hypothetical protein